MHACVPGTQILLPWLRPVLMADQLVTVSVLGNGPTAGAKGFTWTPDGLLVDYAPPAPSLTTLTSFWSQALNDTAPCGLRDCGVYTGDHYSVVRVEGSCVPSSTPGAVKVGR